MSNDINSDYESSSDEEDFQVIEENVINTELKTTVENDEKEVQKENVLQNKDEDTQITTSGVEKVEENRVSPSIQPDTKPKRRGRPPGPNYKGPKNRGQDTAKIISETDDTVVILKSRRRPPRKKQIILYKEDLEPDFEKPIEVITKTRRRGRPRKTEVIQEINETEKIEIERPVAPVKEPTEREIKKLELQEKLLQAEVMMGKKARLNKKGDVDGRMLKSRTEAQKKATEKMLLARKVQREIKAKEKAEKDKEAIDESVKQLVSSLSKAKREVQEQVKPVEEKPKIDLSIFG